MDQIRSPSRQFRKNSPFNRQQVSFIVVKYEQSKSIKAVQRAFRREFYPKSTRKVPNILSFTRTLKRFKEETALWPQVPGGRTSESLQNNIDTVKNHFEQNRKWQCKANGKSAWLELRSNLENSDKKSQMEGAQVTPDAVSESGQYGSQGWQRAVFGWALKRSGFRELFGRMKNGSS